MGQTFSPQSSGGYLTNNTLSRKVRHASQPMLRFRQFTRKEPGFGKNKGQKVLFDRVSNVATAGGTINELAKMPETQTTLSQGECVVNEYGNSLPWTGKLEALSEFNVSDIVMKALRDDEVKSLDLAAGTEFQTAPVKAISTGTESAPTTTYETTLATTATRDAQVADVKNTADRMESTYLTPKFDGQNFMCITSVGFARDIFDDPDFEDAAKYGDPTRLFAGEVGRYYGVRFVKETNVLSDLIGAAATYSGEAIFFGDDPIVEGVSIPEEFRQKVSTDYGRDKGLAWYGIMGWSLTYDSSTAGELKVIQHISA